MSEDLKNKIFNVMQALHDKGIPLPVLQDQASKNPSISYTLLIVSGLILIAALFHVDHLDYTQCQTFFTTCSGLYFLRKVTEGGKNLLGKADDPSNNTPNS